MYDENDDLNDNNTNEAKDNDEAPIIKSKSMDLGLGEKFPIVENTTENEKIANATTIGSILDQQSIKSDEDLLMKESEKKVKTEDENLSKKIEALDTCNDN